MLQLHLHDWQQISIRIEPHIIPTYDSDQSDVKLRVLPDHFNDHSIDIVLLSVATIHDVADTWYCAAVALKITTG